jgi:diaminopimelate decarboxylase
MNGNHDLFFDKAQILEVIKQFPTPFHIYDEAGIRNNARRLYRAYSWAVGFKNFFAVKACPNVNLIRMLKEEGMGVDCSSMPELLVAEKLGFRGDEIMFTSNDTPAAEFRKAFELGAIINLDDITHIEFLEQSVGRLPELVCCRYNPGPLRGGNVIIGKPEEAKYGFTKEQLFEGYRILKEKGVKRFGLHTMIVSNETNVDYHVETARMLLDLVAEISEKVGITFEFINVGGGIGIPYRPEQKAVDLEELGGKVRKVYEEYVASGKVQPGLKLYMENGRMVTGPYGYLVTTAIHHKETYRNYIGVDACMANLMRPGMYGAYHHITVLGKEDSPCDQKYDVVGGLCENNDKFAVERMLPKIEMGDIIAMHNSGAHGYAMGFNYNGKLKSAELLWKGNGKVVMIRRAETPNDYFATFDFPGSEIKFS